ncbi:MAG: acyltransferase [Thermodesulfobacteriota bacterium]
MNYSPHNLARRYLYKIRNIYDIRKKISGMDNSISAGEGFLRKVSIAVEGNKNSIIVNKNALVVDSRIRIRGSNHQLIIGEESYIEGVNFFFEGSNCRIEMGHNSIAYSGVSVSAAENECSVAIGPHCLLAEGVDIRTTDSHPILDLSSKERINPSRSIVIGRQVWLGKECVVLKGVTIGAGSVIGLRSVVTGAIPPNCSAVGVPARVVRENICWSFD